MPRTAGGGLRGNTIGYVLFYGVVSAQTEKVVDFFMERDDAEVMIGEVREDGRRWRKSCGSR